MNNYINGLNSQYASSDYYSQSVNNIKENISNKDYSKATDEELMDACKTFEAYFIEQAFKGMEKMITKSDDEGSSSTSYSDMFMGKLYQEYSELATERGDGIGIAKMLFEQMKRNYDI